MAILADTRQHEAEKRLWLKPRLDELMELHHKQSRREGALLLPIGGSKAKWKPPTP